jgi:hypothetical protein
MKVIESWSGCGSSCKYNGHRSIGSKMCGLDRIMRFVISGRSILTFSYIIQIQCDKKPVDNNVRPKPSDWTLLARLTVRWQFKFSSNLNLTIIVFIMLRDSRGRRAQRKAFNDFQRSCLAISPKIHVQFLIGVSDVWTWGPCCPCFFFFSFFFEDYLWPAGGLYSKLKTRFSVMCHKYLLKINHINWCACFWKCRPIYYSNQKVVDMPTFWLE